MSFEKISNIKMNRGFIHSFKNYKIYVIPSDKLQKGISPIIDDIIDKKINLSLYCKRGAGISIQSEYIYKILNSKDFYLFIVTITNQETAEIWEDEPVNQDLINKVESLVLSNIDDYSFLNDLTKQLNLKPLGSFQLLKISKSSRDKTIQEIISELEKKIQQGGRYINETYEREVVYSFMFIEKHSFKDYYIKVRCTSDFKNDYFKDDNINESRFPWGTYFLYIFLKSFGSRSVNIYNHASSKNVIYYHKRFLFNLGNKPCDEQNDIYDTSKLIEFPVMKGPNREQKAKLERLIEDLPEDYETKSGFKMKICDLSNYNSIIKLSKLKRYLEEKFKSAFRDKIEVYTVPISSPYRSSSKKSSKRNNSNSNRKKSVKNNVYKKLNSNM